MEAFADAVITKYQQTIVRHKTAEKPQEEWMTRKEVMTLLRRCDSTMTKWARLDCYKFWLRRHAGKDYPSYSALIDDMLDKVLALDKDAKAFVSEHGYLF